MTNWLLRPAPRHGAEVRLFCFPYAGTGASIYRGWPDGLGPGIDVYGVQPPGRENRLRERPYGNLRSLSAAAAAAIRPHLGSTYAMFGHSMGAVVAFEVARALRDAGAAEPAWLFVSGRRSPRIADDDAPLHPLPDEGFVTEIQRRYGGIPDTVLRQRDLLALLLPGLRADVRAFETYEYVPADPLSCPITALGGDSDPHAGRDAVAAWRMETSGPFDLRLFSGGHFYLGAAQTDVTALIGSTLQRHRRLRGVEWQRS